MLWKEARWLCGRTPYCQLRVLDFGYTTYRLQSCAISFTLMAMTGISGETDNFVSPSRLQTSPNSCTHPHMHIHAHIKFYYNDYILKYLCTVFFESNNRQPHA